MNIGMRARPHMRIAVLRASSLTQSRAVSAGRSPGTGCLDSSFVSIHRAGQNHVVGFMRSCRILHICQAYHLHVIQPIRSTSGLPVKQMAKSARASGKVLVRPPILQQRQGPEKSAESKVRCSASYPTMKCAVSSLCVLLGPLLGCGNSLSLVLLPCLRNIVGEGVVGVRGAKESLNGEQNGANLQGRRPVAYFCQPGHSQVLYRVRLTLEDIETDATQPVDVWVVDLGQEADLGRGHGVVIGEEELELEDAAYMLSATLAECRVAPARLTLIG
jgi:hypothetical protein